MRQRKTGRPVRFELTEQTRQAIDEYLAATGKKSGDYLFGGRRAGQSMTTRQYARLLSEWLVGIGLDPHAYGTHSLRRTKATLIYRRTGNLRRFNFFLATPRLRARCGIWASMLTMLWLSRNRLKSEHLASASQAPMSAFLDAFGGLADVEPTWQNRRA